MKKHLIALGAIAMFAFGALPGAAFSNNCCCDPCINMNPCNQACPCPAAPLANPCCNDPCPCVSPCPVVPCCPAPCVEACPCPAAPMEPTRNDCAD